MSDIEPTRPPFQYSLWSLFVLTTFVAVLCSILVCTDWAVPVVIIVGIGICLVGFGKLSFRKHPEAGIAFSIAGFVVRFVGLAIISVGLFLFAAQVIKTMRQRGIF
jgi:hypothetical protein